MAWSNSRGCGCVTRTVKQLERAVTALEERVDRLVDSIRAVKGTIDVLKHIITDVSEPSTDEISEDFQ